MFFSGSIYRAGGSVYEVLNCQAEYPLKTDISVETESPNSIARFLIFALKISKQTESLIVGLDMRFWYYGICAKVSLNTPIQSTKDSLIRGHFGPNSHLHPYHVYISSEVFGESAHLHRIA